MLPLRFARRWRSASLFLLVAVLAATLMPAVWFWDDRRSFLSWITNIDKWLHALTFAFLAVWFAGLYRPGSYWRIAVGLLLFGALIEFCQSFVTYRTAEWFDLFADAAGIAAGLMAAFAGLNVWCVRLEAWLAPANPGKRVD